MPSPAWLETLLAEHADCIKDCDIRHVRVHNHRAEYEVTFACAGTHPLLEGVAEGVGEELAIYVTHRAHVAECIWAEIERRGREIPVSLRRVYPHQIIEALGADV